jgi:hypothetical protein
MTKPILSIFVLLRQAADALEDAYKDRADVPPAVPALIATLRERSEPSVVAVTPDEPDPEDASTVSQDEP